MEYLLLTSILMKSSNDLQVPFRLIDFSKEGEVVKDEFEAFCKLLSPNSKKKLKTKSENNLVQTSLKTHFFGINGGQSLDMVHFSNFIEKFQREILEVEFRAYSGGKDVMVATKFAPMILKYSRLTPEEYKTIISNIPEDLTISFEDALLFHEMLKKLEDFAVIVKFYASLGSEIGRKEYQRASKICLERQELPDNLVQLVFCLFDIQGENQFLKKNACPPVK